MGSLLYVHDMMETEPVRQCLVATNQRWCDTGALECIDYNCSAWLVSNWRCVSVCAWMCFCSSTCCETKLRMLAAGRTCFVSSSPPEYLLAFSCPPNISHLMSLRLLARCSPFSPFSASTYMTDSHSHTHCCSLFHTVRSLPLCISPALTEAGMHRF